MLSPKRHLNPKRCSIELTSIVQPISITRFRNFRMYDPEEVERAKRLVQDVNYPPPYAMLRLAPLLAIHLDSESE